MSYPVEVRHASMRQRWDKVAFLHWRYGCADVAALLPGGIEVDVLDGDAWVSLVAFVRVVAAPRVLPAVPWLSIFLETHVRTYVRGPDGGRGVWYLSLDADRLAATVIGRRLYGVPYRWSRLRLETAGDVVVYNTRRRRPRRPRVTSQVAVEVGEPIAPDEMGSLDRFLTARSRLYAARQGGVYAIDVEHDPWHLSSAKVLHLEDSLVAATGLGAPAHEPAAHYCGGMEARVGRRAPVAGPGGLPAPKTPIWPRPAFPATHLASGIAAVTRGGASCESR